MFGVVPKVMWSKLIAVDEYNCIPQATNCVLVQTGRQNVLIDTGYGSKLRDKERTAAARPIRATRSSTTSQAKGLSPDDIDLVILSHLHFDHAGGGIRLADGKLVHDVLREPSTSCSGSNGKLRRPAIPSCGPPIRMENIAPLEDSGQLRAGRRRRRDHAGNLRANYRRPHQRPAGPVYRERGTDGRLPGRRVPDVAAPAVAVVHVVRHGFAAVAADQAASARRDCRPGLAGPLRPRPGPCGGPPPPRSRPRIRRAAAGDYGSCERVSHADSAKRRIVRYTATCF